MTQPSWRAHPSHKISHLACRSTVAAPGLSGPRNEDQVQSRRCGRIQPPVPFTQPPLHAVSYHSVADLLAHNKSHSGSRRLVLPRLGKNIEDEILSGYTPAPMLHRQEGRARPQAIHAAEPLPAALVAHGDYFLAMVTVSFFRPLRRRRRITSRPAAVLMRFRKPWVRFRLLRWGWKVLFDT
jgi:hypothetical protein